MPNKRVDNLKDEGSRHAGQVWQKNLRLKNLTTREWDAASIYSANGMDEEEIRKKILKSRKKK